MKRALVLAGGGSKGAFQAGAVEFLVRESGLDFDIYLGTSVGALNAGILAQSRNYRELREQTGLLKKLWLDIKGSSSIYRKNFLGIFSLLFRDSIYKPIGLQKLIQEWIDPERLFSNRARVLKIPTVAEETGELLYVDNRSPDFKEHFLAYILASASIPLFFPAVKINGLHWYDGGLRDITPLGAVFRELPTEIVVILTFSINQTLHPVLATTKHQGALQAILRTFEIMSNEISANDLQLAYAINQSHRCQPGQRRVPIKIIAPGAPLVGANAMEFNPEYIRQNLKLGFEAAQRPISLCERPLKPVTYKL